MFAGTALANCDSLADDVKTCQKAGKIVTISLGGATGEVGFASDSEAETFADTIWNLFLGGDSPVRPFGDAILDGYVHFHSGVGARSWMASRLTCGRGE